MTPLQITLEELLRFPDYRKWFSRTPQFEDDDLPQSPQWRVWAKVDGEWKKKEFDWYAEAFDWIKRNLKKIEDGAIQHKRHATKEPFASPPVEDHKWCGYCRRPTIFRKHRRGHHFDVIIRRKLGADPTHMRDVRRCSICGIPDSEVSHMRRHRG